MKIVNIAGGLGNQMFQYAFALGLKNHFKQERIIIDVSTFKGLKIAREFELANVFDIELEVATPKELRQVTYYSSNPRIRAIMHKVLGPRKTEYKEPRLFSYWGEETYSINGNCYYTGSWQNEKYFRNSEALVRKAFVFKSPLDERNVKLLEQIQECESVSIHVRRGDYLNYPFYQGICDLPYYKNAISYIIAHVKNPRFFVFSTDTEWCQENIAPLLSPHQCSIVNWNEGKESYKDMQLMSCCAHNIIAHSSFSWWSAWLNVNPKKIVVAPTEWFKRADITDTPQLEEWKLVDNK